MVDISEINKCSNGCVFAKKMPTQSSFKYEGETLAQPFLWRCMKIDQIVTIDSIFHKVGCASFAPNNVANEAAAKLIADVDKKLEDINVPAIEAKIEEEVIAGAAEQDINKQVEALVTEVDKKIAEVEQAIQKPAENTAVTTEKVTEGIPVHQMEVTGKAPLIDIAKPIIPESASKKRTRRTKAEMEAARATGVDNSPPDTTHAEIETTAEPAPSPSVEEQK
jgi:hypothetical protein